VNWLRHHLKDSLFFNAYLLIAMRILGAGMGFLFWMLAAHAAAADEVGIASGAVSAATLFAGLAQLGLGYGLVRHLADSDDPNSLLNLSLITSGLAALVLAGLFLIALPLWGPELLPLRASLTAALVFVSLVLSTTTTQLMHWVFMAARRLSFSLWKMSIQSALAIVLLIVLLPRMSGYLAIVTAYTLATILALAISFWPFLALAQPGYRFSLRFNRSFRTPFASYSFVNYLADQVNRAPDTVLPLIVIQQFGAGTGAVFFIVWTLGRSIAAWAGSIAESLFAEAAGRPERAGVQVWRAARLGLPMALGIAAAVILAGPLILKAYGPEYVAEGATLLSLVALSGAPTVLLAIFVNYLRVHDRLRAVSIIMACSVGAGMLLFVTLMQVGLVAAGAGWLAAQVAVLAGALLWWRCTNRARRSNVSDVVPGVEASERVAYQ